MRAADFLASDTGRLVPTIQQQIAFVPAPLPPGLDRGAIAVAMGDAMLGLGELKGACRRLQNASILIRPLQRQEALTSSAMEGTFTTADELVLAEAGVERDGDDSTREVVNYIRALNQSLSMLETLPISHRVITAAHATLLSGLSAARGAQKRPGEYKSDQNWIGGRTIEAARYVPPPPLEALACMDALESYINREDRGFPTALIDLALVHYQIEAIHPFADGNGRIGRMLVSLMAVDSGLLEKPVLYMSPSLEAEKDLYIDLMFAVSARGEWSPWLIFFFRKIAETCAATVSTIDRLISLQQTYREEASTVMRTAKALMLIDSLFEQPAVTISGAAARLSVTYNAAAKIVDKLVEIGILSEFPDIYPKTYVAQGVMRAARPD